MTAPTVSEIFTDLDHLATVLDRDVDDLVIEALLEYVETRQAEADRTIRALLTPPVTRTLDHLEPPMPFLEFEREEAAERAAIRNATPEYSAVLVAVLAASKCATRRRPSRNPWRIDRVSRPA